MKVASVALTWAVVLLTVAGPSDQPRGSVPQFRLDAFQEGGGVAWFLTMNSSGELAVTVGDKRHKRQIDKASVGHLVELVRRERVNQLAEVYGQPLYDVSWRTFSIWIDGRPKTVTLYADLAADPRQDDIKRALRAWMAIRDLFEVPGAADSRPADRRILAR